MSVNTLDADAFLVRLNGIHHRISHLQLYLAMGELLMALEEAAIAGITLNAQHLAVIAAIRRYAAEGWAWSTGLGYAQREWSPIPEHRDNRLFPIDGFVPRAESVLELLPYSNQPVFEVAQVEPELLEVLSTLFPRNTYEEFASLSIDEVRARYATANNKSVVNPSAYPCWSCGQPVTEDERSANDGFCPHCMQELDSEYWPPKS